MFINHNDIVDDVNLVERSCLFPINELYVEDIQCCTMFASKKVASNDVDTKIQQKKTNN